MIDEMLNEWGWGALWQIELFDGQYVMDNFFFIVLLLLSYYHDCNIIIGDFSKCWKKHNE